MAKNYPISVIISVYRGLDYIEKCINSLMAQTFQEFEFILIDDRGGDGSFEKAKSIIENSIIADRSRYVVHERNRGIAAARNTGIATATGEYIVFLDSDDFFEPNLLEDLYNSGIENDADLVISDFIREMPNGVSVYAKDTFDEDMITEMADKERYIREMLMSVKGCAPWNKIAKKELYTTNQISFHDNMRDDLSVTPIMVYYAARIAFVHKPLLHFVQYNFTSGTYSFNHLPFVGNALVHLESFFTSKGMDYSRIFLKYKANTKRKMLMHPKPEMELEEMFKVFPEVDSALRAGDRLEPKIQYQIFLLLTLKKNKIWFKMYRALLCALLRLKSSF